MANIKSAKKSARQAEKRREVNLARKTAIKTAVKKLLVAIEKQEPQTTLTALFNDAQAKLARAKGKGLICPNTASRKIGRLAKHIVRSAK